MAIRRFGMQYVIALVPVFWKTTETREVLGIHRLWAV